MRIGLIAILLTAGFSRAEINGDWAGTDDLGRRLPTAAEVGPPKPNRAVGLFYWQWHTGLRAGADFDVTEYLKSHPKQDHFLANPAGGPRNPTWYWGQPIFGYYRSDDPWVIRRQLPLIAGAGVDFLFMDYTNGSVYDRELQTFLDVRGDLLGKGLDAPKVTFFLNSQPEWKAESLYLNWYKPGKFDDVWYRLDGKPLLMSPMPTDGSKLRRPELLKEIQDYFTWRPTWALEKPDKNKRMWRFIAGPEKPAAVGPDGKPEQMVVCKSMGGPIWSALKDGGVSAVAGGKPHVAADYDGGWTLPDAAEGKFFAQGWDEAEKVGPPILLVTGWNEWTASVWETDGVVMLGKPTPKGWGHIVDEFNMQFDRDLEPMRGGYFDDYYWQLAERIRKYKGMAPATATGKHRVYHDTIGDVAKRDWDGNVKGLHYTDDSARNDLATAEVTDTPGGFECTVTTVDPITPAVAGRLWMTLFVDVDQNRKTGWDGYDLRVSPDPGNKTATIFRCTDGGYTWKGIEHAAIKVGPRSITVTIPRLLLPAGRFDLKWADGLPECPKVDDFYTAGDVAPDGRFNYRFGP